MMELRTNKKQNPDESKSGDEERVEGNEKPKS